MSTINYATSDIITVGLNVDELTSNIYPKNEVEDESIINKLDELYSNEELNYYRTAKSIIDDFYFTYFKIDLQCGYYNGFIVNIYQNVTLNDIKTEYDDIDEMKDTTYEYINDLKNLKQLLLKVVKEANLVTLTPGWVTGYDTHAHSIANIETTFDKLIEEAEMYLNSMYSK